MGANTIKWQRSEHWVLDLATVPNKYSEDLEVIDVWEGVNVHAILACWMYLRQSNKSVPE